MVIKIENFNFQAGNFPDMLKVLKYNRKINRGFFKYNLRTVFRYRSTNFREFDDFRRISKIAIIFQKLYARKVQNN